MKHQYHLDNLKTKFGLKFGIQCSTQELAKEVDYICTIFTNLSEHWKKYNTSFCVLPDGYSDIDYCKKLRYFIIPAEEFLQAQQEIPESTEYFKVY